MRRTLLLALFLLLNACAPKPADSAPQSVDLIPYATSTRRPLPTPEGLVAASTALPSPTPFTYTVQSGDTLGGIALKFGVSLNDLQAANPEVLPNSLSIGTVLKIPSNPDNPSGEPTPTAVPFVMQQFCCYPTVDKGMWCFALVRNDYSDFIENVSAQVMLMDANGSTIASQIAILPLNILPPHTSLPLSVYFPPEVPFTAKAQIQILTAIRLFPSDARYLPATINNSVVQVAWNGHSAQVSGQVVLPAESKPAGQVWVAAVAYDEAGRVVGVRRWEGSGIQPGGNLPFRMTVSSLGGRLARVEFAVEARP